LIKHQTPVHLAGGPASQVVGIQWRKPHSAKQSQHLCSRRIKHRNAFYAEASSGPSILRDFKRSHTRVFSKKAEHIS